MPSCVLKVLFIQFYSADEARTPDDEEDRVCSEGEIDGGSDSASRQRGASSLEAALQLAKRLHRLQPEWERWQAWLASAYNTK